MGANAEATRAVREAAFDEVEWTTQEASAAAVNGVPTSSTDGVSLEGASAFGFQVVKVSGTVALEITVHGYANGAWAAIPDAVYTVTDTGIIEGTNLGGLCERVYVEISAYTTGTVNVAIGVPKP